MLKDHLKPLLILLVVSAGCWYFTQMALTSATTGIGIVTGVVATLLCLLTLTRERFDQRFLLRLFFGALALRLLVGGLIYWRGLQGMLGPDSLTYDAWGGVLTAIWEGQADPRALPLNVNRSGWGMPYYVGAVYYLIGRNTLAVQMVNCTLGAMTCVLIYKIAYLIYGQQHPRVARWSGLVMAVTPSMILWSCQAIKEAPLMFCISLCAYLALRLCRKMEVGRFVLMAGALFAIYSLRNYAFFIIFIAIAGALFFSMMKMSAVRSLQGMILVVVLGSAFAYFGAGQVATQYDLKQVQAGRAWSAKVSGSGYGGDVDITDKNAALAYLPIGIAYVLFAPFPWEVKNMGQALAVPEMFFWWATFPFLVQGYWFMIRHRLPESLPLCIFTLGLTVVYALFQTNVGTVHRQRTQVLVFFIIFVCIGIDCWREARRLAVARLQFDYAANQPLVRQPLTGARVR